MYILSIMYMYCSMLFDEPSIKRVLLESMDGHSYISLSIVYCTIPILGSRYIKWLYRTLSTMEAGEGNTCVLCNILIRQIPILKIELHKQKRQLSHIHNQSVYMLLYRYTLITHFYHRSTFS